MTFGEKRIRKEPDSGGRCKYNSRLFHWDGGVPTTEKGGQKRGDEGEKGNVTRTPLSFDPYCVGRITREEEQRNFKLEKKKKALGHLGELRHIRTTSNPGKSGRGKRGSVHARPPDPKKVRVDNGEERLVRMAPPLGVPNLTNNPRTLGKKKAERGDRKARRVRGKGGKEKKY